MRVRAATGVLFAALAAFGMISATASPAMAQGVRATHPAKKPAAAPALRHSPLSSLAERQNDSADTDLPPAAARYGLSLRFRREWLLLGLAQHAAAFFDARTTREAMRNNYRELDPMLRPFAHSVALYPVMQIAPTGLDWLAARMATSRRRWLRRIWWLPQAAAAAGFLWSGAHNIGLPAAR